MTCTQRRLMKTMLALIPAAILGTLTVLPAYPARGEVRVVATVSDLAEITREVGGDRVRVMALCQGYQNAHYLEPKPSYARELRKADLLIYTGLELEVGWLPPLLDTARNPKIRPGSQGLLEAASALESVLEIPDSPQDRSQGDVHPFGNPHIFVDPRNGVAIAEAIAERLSILDPEGTDGYTERLKAFEDRMAVRIREWEDRAAPLRGAPVVAYHKQWEYLADWLGLEFAGYIENRPGIPPSPRHVDALIEQIEHQQVRFILCSTFADVDATEEVARRAGTRAVILPAGVNGVEGTGTYEDLIEEIIRRLLEGAAQSQS